MSLYGPEIPTPILKIYHQRLRVHTGPMNWDLMEGLVRWLRDDFGHGPGFTVEDSDGTFSAPVKEARKHVESQGTSVVQATIHISKGDLGVDARYHQSQTEVAVRGSEPNAVFGLVARIRAAVERGVIRGASKDQLVTYDSVVTTGPGPSPRPAESWWRRFLRTPNQWVLIIGGTIIAGLVVWWLTTLFAA